MLAILSITAPIFLVIALGFVAVRSGFFARADMRVMGSFVINFALPAMLFKALSQRSFGEAMQMDYLAVYAVGSLIAVAATAALARKWRKRDLQSSSIFGMGSGMSNSAFIGYPVVSQALGPIASVAMALNMLVETLLVLPIVMVTADGQKAGSAGIRHILAGVFGRLLKNPMIIAILLGFGFSLLDWHLPAPLFRAVDMLSQASGPLALFVIGGNLTAIHGSGMIGDVGLITAGKLLMHPLAMLVLAALMPGMAPELRAAAVLYACVPMLSIYAIIGQKYGLEQLCSAALVTATIASFFTISIVLWLLSAMGWIAKLT